MKIQTLNQNDDTDTSEEPQILKKPALRPKARKLGKDIPRDPENKAKKNKTILPSS